MPRPIPGSRLDSIVGAVEKQPQGATLLDIAFALNPPPPLRNVQRWLGALVRRGRLVREGSTKGTRYQLPSRVTKEPAVNASLEGEAIQCLVNQPVEVRAVADDRRISLESYSPNCTAYIPADVRARLTAPFVATNGAAVARSWRDPTILNQLTVDLARRSGWPEAQLAETTPAPLSMPDVTAWLALPESTNARFDVQLLWNQAQKSGERITCASRLPDPVGSISVGSISAAGLRLIFLAQAQTDPFARPGEQPRLTQSA